MKQRLAYLAAAVLACAAASCGGNGSEDPNKVFQDEASDEAWTDMVDSVNRGETQVSELDAAHLTAPTDGAVLPASPPATFMWDPPAAALRHGVNTGTFVWLHFAGQQLSPPIDVVSITSHAWTPDADLWARLSGAGQVDVTITTAVLIDGHVREGPFQSATPTTSFSIQGT